MPLRNTAVTAAAVALATFACTREPEPVEHEVSSCVSCHESQELLMATAIPEPVEPESEAEGESWGGSVSPLEAWEKVWIEREEDHDFMDTVHGEIACEQCHGGDPLSEEKEQAHVAMVADPAADPIGACGECHGAEAVAHSASIHALLTGERTAIELRVGHPMEGDEILTAGFNQSCNGCHASCGDCHVSRPNSVGGGFINGHVFERTPDMVNQCTACHGSRVGEEYRGQHREDIPTYKGDVHYLSGMRCESCHDATEMHEAQAEHRYAVAEMPLCEDCHAGITGANAYHREHLGELSCQVCHSQDYKQCQSCHVPDGLDEPSWLGFKIGRNPLPENRPYEWVTLRKIPIAETTYLGWGTDGPLAEFNALPTWKYATPHNIQRWTDRTRVAEGAWCGAACHLSPATAEGWFLREVDLSLHPDEAEANRPYAVPDHPPHEW